MLPDFLCGRLMTKLSGPVGVNYTEISQSEVVGKRITQQVIRVITQNEQDMKKIII